MKPRVLFILKQKSSGYGTNHDDFEYETKTPSGLYNSAKFVVNMLISNGLGAKLVEVVDNNCIDREVSQYKPTHVVIEGLWVVPDKFIVLSSLHPYINWIVRIHSEVPFLAQEGVAMDWIRQYAKLPKVSVSSNSQITVRDLNNFLQFDSDVAPVVFLPNYYSIPVSHPHQRPKTDVLNIACFGAIRPLKNQLIQAMAAMQYCNTNNKTLRFHINSSRKEQGGENSLKNIRALFEGNRHQLIEYSWMNHYEFLNVLKDMDVSMCVSFSESFCIVAADSIGLGVPVVLSDQIEWGATPNKASTTDVENIVDRLGRVLNPFWKKILVMLNQKNLHQYCNKTREIWLEYLHK